MKRMPGDYWRVVPAGEVRASDVPATGRRYWRSLEEYSNTPQFREWAEREFPQLASELDDSYRAHGPSRRRFLQLMAASIALAGVGALTGCRRPEGQILTASSKRSENVPGLPLFYATTMVLAGAPIGLLAETHEGRPTKLEGNPLHPTSFGATSTFAQASVLDLYDPDRSRTTQRSGNPVDYRTTFLTELDKLAATLKDTGGRGLAILSEDFASPAVEMLRAHIERTFPGASWHVYEPSNPTNEPRPLLPFDNAQVILSLDCDFLGAEDQGVRFKKQFARSRQPDSGRPMSRLYVVEPGFSITGASADHRLRLPASQIADFAKRLLAALSTGGSDDPWMRELAADLGSQPGRSLVVAGVAHPELRDVVNAINSRLGNPAPRPAPRTPTKTLAELVQRFTESEVSTLLILGGNPAYTAPADYAFEKLIRQVQTSIRLGVYEDETSACCTWHVPMAHYLESWGDALAPDGTISAVQPMIEPLLGGVTAIELLARVSGFEQTSPYEIVRRSFREIAGADGFEENWRRFLHEGVWRAAVAARDAGVAPVRVHQSSPAPSASNLEVRFVPSDSVFDGRFANNGWMQECPDPMTKLVWDNAAILSPRTARELQLSTGDVIEIELDGRRVQAPVFTQPGHADYSITLPLGYGRTKTGAIGTGAGFNAYALRTSSRPWFAVGAKVTRTGKTYPLASTQDHHALDESMVAVKALKDRAIVREGTLERLRKEPDFAKHMGVHSPTTENIGVNPLDKYVADKSTHQWGMAIDLTSCVGCNGCVIACQSENNIPIVGKDEVIRGREMNWMRIDRYFSFSSPESDATAVVQPMMCQHCENAPCEPVCPVNATVHDHEGLNTMVYNRCIGTRYCANNCPYKVRRFNFFDYNKGTLRSNPAIFRDGDIEPRVTKGYSLPQLFQPKMEELPRMQKNPEVTVRMRGVMEKCTYCVQRIQHAHHEQTIKAGQNGKPGKIPDGTIQTACQQSCPTDAIVFGDLNDPDSRVSRLRANQRSYDVLESFNTRPRTSYLARIRNVNPRMPEIA